MSKRVEISTRNQEEYQELLDQQDELHCHAIDRDRYIGLLQSYDERREEINQGRSEKLSKEESAREKDLPKARSERVSRIRQDHPKTRDEKPKTSKDSPKTRQELPEKGGEVKAGQINGHLKGINDLSKGELQTSKSIRDAKVQLPSKNRSVFYRNDVLPKIKIKQQRQVELEEKLKRQEKIQIAVAHQNAARRRLTMRKKHIIETTVEENLQLEKFGNFPTKIPQKYSVLPPIKTQSNSDISIEPSVSGFDSESQSNISVDENSNLKDSRVSTRDDLVEPRLQKDGKKTSGRSSKDYIMNIEDSEDLSLIPREECIKMQKSLIEITTATDEKTPKEPQDLKSSNLEACTEVPVENCIKKPEQKMVKPFEATEERAYYSSAHETSISKTENQEVESQKSASTFMSKSKEALQLSISGVALKTDSTFLGLESSLKRRKTSPQIPASHMLQTSNTQLQPPKATSQPRQRPAIKMEVTNSNLAIKSKHKTGPTRNVVYNEKTNKGAEEMMKQMRREKMKIAIENQNAVLKRMAKKSTNVTEKIQKLSHNIPHTIPNKYNILPPITSKEATVNSMKNDNLIYLKPLHELPNIPSERISQQTNCKDTAAPKADDDVKINNELEYDLTNNPNISLLTKGKDINASKLYHNTKSNIDLLHDKTNIQSPESMHTIETFTVNEIKKCNDLQKENLEQNSEYGCRTLPSPVQTQQLYPDNCQVTISSSIFSILSEGTLQNTNLLPEVFASGPILSRNDSFITKTTTVEHPQLSPLCALTQDTTLTAKPYNSTSKPKPTRMAASFKRQSKIGVKSVNDIKQKEQLEKELRRQKTVNAIANQNAVLKKMMAKKSKRTSTISEDKKLKPYASNKLVANHQKITRNLEKETSRIPLSNGQNISIERATSRSSLSGRIKIDLFQSDSTTASQCSSISKLEDIPRNTSPKAP